MSGKEPPELQHRLDPDRAARGDDEEPGAGSGDAGARTELHNPEPPLEARRSEFEPVIDTRPYKMAIAAFGLVLVLALSVYQFLKNGIGTPGVTAGHQLRYFVAPLSTSSLNGDANLKPRCDPAQPNAAALNVCPWLLARAPLVLSFFVTGSSDCKRQVDAMQALSRRFRPSAVQFAAVAVKTSHHDAAAAVRAHHWTIPVAFDPDGAVGEYYGVSICPLVELVSGSGTVKDRLIGSHYTSAASLAPKVQALINSK